MRALQLFLLIVLPSPSFAQTVEPNNEVIEYKVEIDESGDIVLVPLDSSSGHEGTISAAETSFTDLPNSTGVLPEFLDEELAEAQYELLLRRFSDPSADQPLEGYVINNAVGEDAFVFVPSGTPPSGWADLSSATGLQPIPFQTSPKAVLAGTRSGVFGLLDPEKARIVLRELSELAAEEYCASSVRPSEFTLAVSLGASLVVTGEASMTAKFITNDICGS